MSEPAAPPLPEIFEGDESPAPDNSLGRMLALSDGVFAIAMTLLALDLKVPGNLTRPSDHDLRHALAQNSSTYLAYGLSFYVIANYWWNHHQILRSVVRTHRRLMVDTMWLLFVVATIPFPTSLIAEYGSVPFAVALYGGFNALAGISLIRLRHDVRQLGLAPPTVAADLAPGWETWGTLAVFLLCIPAAYLLGHDGPWFLLLLLPVGRLAPLQRRWSRRRQRTAA